MLDYYIIQTSVSPQSVHVNFQYQNKLSIAEMSICPQYTSPERTIMYFNRINVHSELRRNGIGNRLLKTLLRHAIENNITIISDINPYGTMTYDQIHDWYVRNGFVEFKYESEDRGLIFNAPSKLESEAGIMELTTE